MDIDLTTLITLTMHAIHLDYIAIELTSNYEFICFRRIGFIQDRTNKE